MSQLSRVLCVVLLIAALAVTAWAADLVISITVSPNVMILSAPTQWVHIHSNIPLSSVDRSSLAVAVEGNAIGRFAVFADSRGFMVIRIDQQLVEGLLAPGTATFVVTGSTQAGTDFVGEDTIQVKR